ncbi:MAG: PQQ-binding-like beta-propeller repeat protein [Anaerolineae bacterium]|nr:PQQ-binding-like beta-propeller repeat protein [Anaerolineae bacterium]
MIIVAFPARLKTIVFVLVLAIVAAGCANTRSGVSWSALDTVTINGTTAIIVSYEKQIDLVSPALPISVVTLLDAEGNPIPDGSGGLQTWVIDGSDYDDAQFFTTPLLIEDDGASRLMFPTYNNRILEFDLQTATPITTTGIELESGVIATPLLTDDMLYVPYRNQNLVALDTSTYTEQWRLETDGGVWSSPVLIDDTLYVTSIDHNLYAVNAATGNILWTADLQGATAASPLYYDEYLYVGSYSHKMFKIDLNGQIVAEYEGENWIWQTPVIVDDILYYADLSGTVFALNSGDLSEIWSNKVADSGRRRGIRPAPLVTEEFVIVASRNGSVYWLNRSTGELIVDRQIEGEPEILSDLLLIEAGTVDRVNVPLIAVATLENDSLVVFFQLDNFTQYGVYER